MCDSKEIPYLDTRYDPHTRIPIVNLYPHADILAEMVLDLVTIWEWTSYTILYESSPWLARLSDLLEMYDPKGHTVTVRRLDLNLPTKNYRSTLRLTRMSEDTNIILECSIDSLPEVLSQMQQVGMLTQQYRYLITTLDAHTIDLQPYQFSDTNITTIRIIRPDNPSLKNFTDYLKELEDEPEEGAEPIADARK